MSQKRSGIDPDTHLKTDKEPSHNLDSIITDSKMPPHVLTSSQNGFSPTVDLLGGNHSYFNCALREALAITGRPRPPSDDTESKLALIRAQEIVAQKEKELQIAIMCRRRQEEENARNELIYHEAVSASRDPRFLAAVSSPKRDSNLVLDATLRKRSLEESIGSIEDRMKRERAMKRAMVLERMREEEISTSNRQMQGNASMLNNFLFGENMRTSSLTQIDRLSRGVRNEDRFSFIGNPTSSFSRKPRSPNSQSKGEMSDKMGMINQIPSVTGLDGFRGFYKKMQDPTQTDANWLRANALRSSAVAPLALTSSRQLENNELRWATPRESEQSPTEGNSVDNMDQQESQKRFNRHQCRQWTVRYQELLAYRAQEGHCNVPHLYNKNRGLAMWVKRQRHQYNLRFEGKPSTLTGERIRLLESIGFVWNCLDSAWDSHFEDLRVFTMRNGHCVVPSNYEENPKLASWVITQRRQLKLLDGGKQSSMSEKRQEKLRKIGFPFPTTLRNSNNIDATSKCA